jgi:hypothetical protein
MALLRTKGRAAIAALLVIVLSGVITTGYMVDAARASPRLPAPTVISSPTNPTTSATATFRYTDTQGGVTFRCSLDGSHYTYCSSDGITYHGLSRGTHAFAVKAEGRDDSLSDPTTFTWRIVSATPAAPRLIEQPSNPSRHTSPEFEFTDASWTNVTFSCQLDSRSVVPCTGDTDHDGDHDTQGEIEYHHVSPGQHCFSVFATDRVHNAGPSTTYCWTIVGTLSAGSISAFSGTPQFATISTAFGSPLVALVTDSHGHPISGALVTFTASASGASVTFASDSEGNPDPYSCVVTTNASGHATGSAFTANGTPGAYSVTATTPGAGAPAHFSLINSANFSISGDITPLLYPGTSQKLDLGFTNPNPSPITIASGAVSITISTTQAGCSPSANFAVTHRLTARVTVPASSTKSLSDLDIPDGKWPVIGMVETHTNQDSCEGAPLTLHYSGSATG